MSIESQVKNKKNQIFKAIKSKRSQEPIQHTTYRASSTNEFQRTLIRSNAVQSSHFATNQEKHLKLQQRFCDKLKKKLLKDLEERLGKICSNGGIKKIHGRRWQSMHPFVVDHSANMGLCNLGRTREIPIFNTKSQWSHLVTKAK